MLILGTHRIKKDRFYDVKRDKISSYLNKECDRTKTTQNGKKDQQIIEEKSSCRRFSI